MLLYSAFVLLSFTAVLANNQLNSKECGKRPFAEEDQKINNGNVSKVGDWPWTVSLQQNGRHFCGGVLVSEIYVFSAAHCLKGFILKNQITVVIGVHNLEKHENYTIVRQISNWWIHAGFNGYTLLDDVALIELSSPVTFSEYITPACVYIPSPNDEDLHIEGKIGWVTGWGNEQVGRQVKTLKEESKVEALSKTRCKELYKNDLFPVSQESQICAGERDVNTGPCQSDSGGPFVAKSPRDGKWYLYGIVSRRPSDYICGFGALYARVAYYIDWFTIRMTKE